jgi:hypothetical protein
MKIVIIPSGESIEISNASYCDNTNELLITPEEALKIKQELDKVLPEQNKKLSGVIIANSIYSHGRAESSLNIKTMQLESDNWIRDRIIG